MTFAPRLLVCRMAIFTRHSIHQNIKCLIGTHSHSYRFASSLQLKPGQKCLSPSSGTVSRQFARYSSSSESDADKGDLVYHGRVGSMFRMLKLFSLTTSTVGLSLQPYMFVTYQDAPLVTAIPFFAALNIFVFVNPFLIHYIGKKYVLEMYFNHQTKAFTAVVLTFFARKYNFTFTSEDVKVPDVPGLFSMLTVKGQPLFVVPSDFVDLDVYKHMMGFDKPLDLTFLREDRKEPE